LDKEIFPKFSNQYARAFCVNQTVSSLKNTATFTAPSGAV
jgi:hypothetical protein